MKFGKRLALIAAFPLLALIVILVGQNNLSSLSSDASVRVVDAHRFFWFVAVAYIVNFIVAWKTISSWPITMSRMLIWGVVAYICLSSVFEVFMDHRELTNQILGSDDIVDAKLISELRLRLGAYLASGVLSCVCIGIGFEKREESKK